MVRPAPFIATVLGVRSSVIPLVVDRPPALTALQIGMTARVARRGGVDRYYFNLLRELDAENVLCRGIVVGDANDLLADDPAGIGCCIGEGSSFIRRCSAFRTAVIDRIRDVDIVVSHFAPYIFPALDSFNSRPLVVHFHGPWALESAAYGHGRLSVFAKHLVERVVYRSAERFIVLSRAFAEILERQYRVDPAAIEIIPGGVDLDRFGTGIPRREARRAFGWDPNRPIVLTVRRLVPSKGLEQFVAAAAIVARSVPDVQFVIVGSGPMAAELQARVCALDLQRIVRFDGHVSEALLPAAYRAADLFCVPSQELEGFGLVALEALASGTPVLVTPVGGLPEVVRPLDPRLALEGKSAQDLARGITDVLRARISVPTPIECRRYAERFAWSNVARRVSEVYRDVAAGRQRSAVRPV